MLSITSTTLPASTRDALRCICRDLCTSDADVLRIVDDGKVLFEARCLVSTRDWMVVVPMDERRWGIMAKGEEEGR